MIKAEDNVLDKMFKHPIWIAVIVIGSAFLNSMWILLYIFLGLLIFGLTQYLIVEGDYKD